MGEVVTVGLDIAKHVFQVHGVDETGAVKSAGSCDDRKCCSFRRTKSLSGWDGSMRDSALLGAVNHGAGAPGEAMPRPM